MVNLALVDVIDIQRLPQREYCTGERDPPVSEKWRMKIRVPKSSGGEL
jgi:hypothetical protein